MDRLVVSYYCLHVVGDVVANVLAAAVVAVVVVLVQLP